MTLAAIAEENHRHLASKLDRIGIRAGQTWKSLVANRRRVQRDDAETFGRPLLLSSQEIEYAPASEAIWQIQAVGID